MKTTHRIATGLLISLSLLAPSVARANTYTVEGCGTDGAGALQFSSNPPSGFDLTDNGCSASSNPTLEYLGYASSGPYTQGEQGSWGAEAPTGETISGLALTGGMYMAADGWLTGWTLDDDTAQNALPSDDDCLSYTPGLCSGTASGWFPITGAESVQEILDCDAVAAGSESCQLPQDGTLDIVAVSEAEDAVVQIDDPGTANPGVSGTLWEAGQGLGLSSGWISGIHAGANLSMSFRATDPGGVCTLEAVLSDADGKTVASSTPIQQTPVTDADSAAAIADNLPAPFASTQPCGGTDTGVTTFAPNLAALPTGTYYLNVASQNPGEYQTGSFTYATGDALAGGAAINIDNSIPSVTVAPSDSSSTSGGSAGNWSPTPESLTVAATDAADSSGLAQITCTTPSGTTSYPVSGDQASVVVSVSTPGSDSVSCDATSVAGNTSTVASAAFDLDAQAPTLIFAGAASAPAWDSGSQNVTVTGSEAVPASGIGSISCELDGGAWSTTPGPVAHLSVTGNGKHEVSCYATTVAGIDGSTTSESIQIDSDAPTLVFSGGPNQAAWHTTGQSITATADAAGGDQITTITCTLGGVTLTYPSSSPTGTESVVIPVAAPGGDLDCEAQDNAGNVSSTKSWSFLIDDTPPTGYFVAASAANPTQVEVSLEDAGSGVSGARIQIDVNGSWRSLPTRFYAASRIATAEIPDDGSLSDGTYALRARVWDKAGNSAYITQNTTGAAESVILPLRERTDITAVLSAGRAHVAATASVAKRHLSVKYGQRVRVAGRLVTADGVPVARATIVISGQLANSATIRAVTKITTNGRGEFSSFLRSGPSRTLLVTYDGSQLLRAASAATAARVTGRVSLAVPTEAIAGRRVTVSGQVVGGHVPRAGLLVQLWYSAAVGHGVWEPFEHAVRANAHGRWSLTFRLSSAVRGRDYAFKAVVAAQGGWPYAGAVSRSASLKVA
jgi:hypothetical protein